MVATSGGLCGAQCNQYRDQATYWAQQADDDFDAMLSYEGSSVMIDQTARDYFFDAYEFDIGQRQYYTGRFNSCNQVER